MSLLFNPSSLLRFVLYSAYLSQIVLTVAVPAPSTSSTTWNDWGQPICPLNNTWTQIALRHPPTTALYGTPTDLSWPAPARSFLFGNWHITYSSRSTYHSLYNFEHDCYPVLPTLSLFTPEDQWLQVDLTSFNLPLTGNATADQEVHAVYGLDTPDWNVAPFVFNFRGTGKLSDLTSTWELVAWGYDTNGNGYRAEFEQNASVYPGEPAFNIVSRVSNGPSEDTVVAIMEAMKTIYADDEDLSAYVRNTTKLPQDNRRAGQGVIGCDQACINND